MSAEASVSGLSVEQIFWDACRTMQMWRRQASSEEGNSSLQAELMERYFVLVGSLGSDPDYWLWRDMLAVARSYLEENPSTPIDCLQQLIRPTMTTC